MLELFKSGCIMIYMKTLNRQFKRIAINIYDFLLYSLIIFKQLLFNMSKLFLFRHCCLNPFTLYLSKSHLKVFIRICWRRFTYFYIIFKIIYSSLFSKESACILIIYIDFILIWLFINRFSLKLLWKRM